MDQFSLREIVGLVLATICATAVLVAAGLAEASAQEADVVHTLEGDGP
jgi:hypothetical protein